MNGTLSGGESLRGSLTVVPEVGGTLSPSGRLSGVVSVAQGVNGSLSVAGGLSGVIERNGTTVYYTGGYTVTPTTTEQILHTDGKVLSDDITVSAIPQNYGLITWNGSWLTVS